MLRVSAKAVVLISSGTPDKRLPFLEEFTEGKMKIDHFELELSHLANLINILRTELKDRPLSHALKDEELLRRAIIMTIEAQEKKRMEEESKDPRKKLLRLMLKAKQKRDLELR
jgi:protoheme ferro-lyase